MQTAGWLAPLTYHRVEVPIALRDIALRLASGESDYERRALSLAARHPDVVRILVAATVPEISNRPTLAFCAGVEHARDLADAYRPQVLALRRLTAECP